MNGKRIALEGFWSDGSCGLPPTQSIGPYAETVLICNRRIQLRGLTRYMTHTIGDYTHLSEERLVVDPGDSTCFIEGYPVALLGDILTDGDHIALNQNDCLCGSA